MVMLQTILVMVCVGQVQVERKDCAGRVSGDTEGDQMKEINGMMLVGADAQVEFPPTQEPFTGDGLTRNRGISTQHWNLQRLFGQAFM